MMNTTKIAVVMCLLALSLGCTENTPQEKEEDTTDKDQPQEDSQIKSFRKMGEEVCTRDGKPVIRLFSTTNCPHCVWIKDTYDKIAREYQDKGLIIAHHWELDTGDDTISSVIETKTPLSEVEVYQKFNPRGSVPTYVFGCKYTRIGNAYERQGDLESEKQEFKHVIESLIKETS